jgi:hypothetical protein
LTIDDAYCCCGAMVAIRAGGAIRVAGAIAVLGTVGVDGAIHTVIGVGFTHCKVLSREIRLLYT